MPSPVKKINEKAILAGDKRAFRLFYKQQQPKLLSYVIKRVSNREDAEEIVQDTFLSFLDALPLYRGNAKLSTFLGSIVRHEIADYFRKKYAKKALQYVPFIDKGYTPDLYSTKETRQQFNKALRSLLPQDQLLIEWKYEQKLSVKEIAKKLDISVKATESRLFRARKAFQLAYVEVTK